MILNHFWYAQFRTGCMKTNSTIILAESPPSASDICVCETHWEYSHEESPWDDGRTDLICLHTHCTNKVDIYRRSQDHHRQASAPWHLIFHTVMPSFNRPEMCFAFSIQMDLKTGKLDLNHLIRSSICLLRLIARARESNCLADRFRALEETQINRSD